MQPGGNNKRNFVPYICKYLQYLIFKVQNKRYGIRISSLETERDPDEESIENIPSALQDDARRIKYHFGAQLTFSLGDKPIKNFTIIERHYFGNVLLRNYEFQFPFYIPNSTNTWKHIYTIPEIAEDMKELMIENPFDKKSDSFYFVGDTLVMHNKAEYDYSQINE